MSYPSGRQRGSKNNSGGPNAPRLPNGNIDWDTVYNKYLLDILRNQPAPNTVRGLMYILESKGVLKKSDYNGLDEHLVKWRLDGHIPWNMIADGSGRGVIGDFLEYQAPDDWINQSVDFLRNGGTNYQGLLKTDWRWFGQPNYIEFMVEKQAVTGTIAAYTEGHYVKIAFNRGNNGWGNAYNYVRHLKEELTYFNIDTDEIEPRNVYVWYLGDNDKYGLNMDRQLRGQLDEFGILKGIHFERIAVLPEQVSEYGIPRSDDKDKGYEIDALNAFRPDLFKQLLLDHIVSYFNEDIHKRVLEMFSEEDINNQIGNKINFIDTS
jgi:hypothetical protein